MRGLVGVAIVVAVVGGVFVGRWQTGDEAQAAVPWQIKTFEGYVSWNNAVDPANEFLATLDPACEVSMSLSTFGSTGTGRLVAVTYRC